MHRFYSSLHPSINLSSTNIIGVVLILQRLLSAKKIIYFSNQSVSFYSNGFFHNSNYFKFEISQLSFLIKLAAIFILVVSLPFLIYTLSIPSEHSAQNTVTPAAKLCSFNKLSIVPPNIIHTFKVKTIKKAYSPNDFDVTWKDLKKKDSPFFREIGKHAKFEKIFKSMGCKVADKKTFGQVCNYQSAQLDQYYANAFGTDVIFKCKVPANHFTLNIRFTLQLSDFVNSAGGRWSVFSGLHQYKDISDANKTIHKQGQKIVKLIKSAALDTFQINSDLNIIPAFVQGTLAWVFNSNINSSYVKSIKANTKYDLSDLGFIKILPPGTEFIIASIYNGTANVKQICDNYRFDDKKDNCGYNFTDYLEEEYQSD